MTTNSGTTSSLQLLDRPQRAESRRRKTGTARPKPRALRALQRRLALEQFRVRESSEDVAELLQIPVRTVSDVVAYDHELRLRLLESRLLGRAA